jgi:LPXTG-site transpeptidase (sortase) family protein
MADSQALAQGINPNTGTKLSSAQKDIVEKYFDMESIINRLTLNTMQGHVAGSSTQSTVPAINYESSQINSNSVRGNGMLIKQTNIINVNTAYAAAPSVLNAELDIDQSKPGLLEVPSLKISAPVVWTKDPKNFDKDLQSGVVHYPGTAMPGQIGTTYISGHSSNYAWAKGSYNRIFSKLGDLPNNASFSITVYLKDGKTVKLHYVASSRKEFLATDQEQFKNTGTSTVALSTCWPVNTTQRRLVVFGELTQIER